MRSDVSLLVWDINVQLSKLTCHSKLMFINFKKVHALTQLVSLHSLQLDKVHSPCHAQALSGLHPEFEHIIP